MPRTLNAYLDAAKTRLNLASDRRLSTTLGLAGPSVCFFRTGRALPSDETMVAIAEAAGIDPAEALVELAVWRAESRHEPRAAAAFARIRDTIIKGAAGLFLVIFGLTMANEVKASVPEQWRNKSAWNFPDYALSDLFGAVGSRLRRYLQWFSRPSFACA